MQQKTLNPDEKSAVKDTSNELVAAVDGVEDTEEDDGDGDDEDAGRGEEDDTFAKPRKWGLQCKECGKRFNRRETFNLHRHFHAHEDELTPLTCKECGLTFQHRSSLIKHRSEHKEKEEQVITPKKEPHTRDERTPVSAHETVRGAGKENTNQTEESKRVFSCPLCPQTCYTPANLRAHMLIHEAETEKVDSRPRPVKDNATKNWEKGHTCPHCPSIFRDEASFYGHLLKVHKSIAHYLEKVTTAPVQKITPLSSDNLQGKWRNDNVNSKSYKCSECGKMFRHRSVLELHMRIHSKDKPYQCKVCGKRFRFSSYLQQHLIIHTGKKPHKCPDCGKDFAFLQNMKTHQKLHQEKPFRCTSCRKGYSDEAQLQHHMLSHNGEKPHKCDLCDKSFGLAYLLRDHMNTHTGERPHRCDECHKSFSWFSSLLVHQKIHARKRQGYSQYTSFPVKVISVSGSDEEEPLQDLNPDLELLCESDQELKEDIETELSPSITVERFDCPECHRWFSSASSLRVHRIHATHYNHIQKHKDPKPYKNVLYQAAGLEKKSFKCDECGKCFSRMSALISHQLHHPKRKPYSCPDCTMSYSHAGSLYNHRKHCPGQKTENDITVTKKEFNPKKTLLGPKIYHCEQCGKGFWSLGAYSHHKQSQTQCADLRQRKGHTAIKVACPVCGRKFRHKGIMKLHMRKHEDGNHKCELCSRSFRLFSSLLRHQVVHNAQFCPDCGKLFSRAKALQFHMKSH
uniref:C2H2-type domain-containing protein n=1 Tax=Myripristis murdjan TaxID=586833 RepID=A0A667Z8G0_9TELE